MNSTYLCPRCGTNLRENDWEMVHETKDGSITLDAHLVYECQDNNCGYMKRSESLPEIIAQQGEDRLLLLYPSEQGRILDVKANLIYPEIHYQSVLARGNWDDYNGNQDVELLLENVRDSESAFIEPPNLFEFATSELSQDAFLCWLMTWSQETHRSLDKSLYEASADFVAMMFNVHGIPVPSIKKMEITRQFQGLDVLAIINDTYAVLIEDKTFTNNHSNQLKRYREAVEMAYPDKIQLPIYYKIADQSHYRSVVDEKYFPFTRGRMLQVLKRGRENGVNHPIYLDYLSYLEKLENKINSYKIKPITEWDSFAWQGFYMELQKYFDADWGYVSNPRGGFWGFWWKPQSIQNQYIQLEQQVLCVKVEAKDVQDLKEFRNKEMESTLLKSKKQGLLLQKPSKLSTGKTMTIAFRPDYLQTRELGLIDMDKTIEVLKKF